MAPVCFSNLQMQWNIFPCWLIKQQRYANRKPKRAEISCPAVQLPCQWQYVGITLWYVCLLHSSTSTSLFGNKKLSYRRGTTQWVVSVEILPIATQQCSTTKVLNKSKLWSWRVKVGRCVVNMCTQPWRYDTRCYFNVRSKANMSQLNYRTEPTTKKCKNRKN